MKLKTYPIFIRMFGKSAYCPTQHYNYAISQHCGPHKRINNQF